MTTTTTAAAAAAGGNPLLSHVLRFLSPLRFPLPSTVTKPTIVALSGPQGAGKTTITNHLAVALRMAPYSLAVAVLSIDDLYLCRDDQVALARANPENKLWQHRGEPGTHDLALAEKVFRDLRNGQAVLPVFDKSLHDGAGDRLDTAGVEVKNVDVLLFEGWCVGFRALPDVEVDVAKGCGNPLKSLLEVNRALRSYDVLTNQFDFLIHIDAADIHYVYNWRLQQERAMIAARGSGMSDAQVRAFVDGYMPAYELYVDNLRRGLFEEKGRHLRVVIGKEREVVKVEEL